MISITSSVNDKFKTWKTLLTAKGSKKEGLFLLSGEKILHEFLQQKPLQVECELVKRGGEPLQAAVPAYELTADLFNELDEVGTHFNIFVVRTPKLADYDPAAVLPAGLSLFCPLGDPANVGALLRSAEAFGAKQVILSTDAAWPFLPKAVKASSGSVWRMPLLRGPRLKEFLESAGHSAIAKQIFVLDQGGILLAKVKWPQAALLIVGEEGPGVGSHALKSSQIVTIPTQGVESLNAVIATSVAMYSYNLQL